MAHGGHGSHGPSPARVQQRSRESLPTDARVGGLAGDRQAQVAGPRVALRQREVCSAPSVPPPFVSLPARPASAPRGLISASVLGRLIASAPAPATPAPATPAPATPAPAPAAPTTASLSRAWLYFLELPPAPSPPPPPLPLSSPRRGPFAGTFPSPPSHFASRQVPEPSHISLALALQNSPLPRKRAPSFPSPRALSAAGPPCTLGRAGPLFCPPAPSYPPPSTASPTARLPLRRYAARLQPDCPPEAGRQS